MLIVALCSVITRQDIASGQSRHTESERLRSTIMGYRSEVIGQRL